MTDPGQVDERNVEDDLRSLHDRYLTILEEQIVVPLRQELAAREGQIDGDRYADSARKVKTALSLLDEGVPLLRSLTMAEMMDAFRQATAR